MKAMFHHHNFNEPPKHFPKYINEAPCTVCFKEKTTTLPKGATFDTTSLTPGELLPPHGICLL